MFKTFAFSIALTLAGVVHASVIPLRVLALGDSITAGGYNALGVWNVGPGYRWDLALMSSWIGSPIQFVGRLKDGPYRLTQFHEGHSGKRVDEIHELIRGQVSHLQPNVILLMAGTNDIIQEHDLGTLAKRLLFLVNQLQTEAPHAHILIGIPPTTGNPTFNNRIRRLEANILTSKIFESANRFDFAPAARPKVAIKVLNFFSKAKLTPFDLTDSVHMAPSGNRKLAEHWAKGLRCVLRNLDCQFL